MFVSHDKTNNKKRIQKPNILRRKQKIFKSTNKKEFEKSLNEKPTDLFKSVVESESSIDSDKVSNKIHVRSNNNTHIKLCEINDIINCNHNIEDELEQTCLFSTAIDTEGEAVQSSLNIDSFLIGNSVKQNVPVVTNIKYNVENPATKTNEKLCFRLIEDFNTLIVNHCGPQEGFDVSEKADVVSTMVPLSAISTKAKNQNNSNLQMPAVENKLIAHKFSIEDLTRYSVQYKCDELNCKKEFSSEEKLTKHKNTHNKVCRVVRQSTLECPVKKIDFTGAEINCEKVFKVKGDLLKHLNEDHTIDDAVFVCDECDRRFFWASGLRAHKRAHLARVNFVCPWPECGRVFRHPCRLREHSRAHTGDKPYHCTHPNCGWSFRTASKLLRHSRRHTGDRRHACAACGRAFLRREHLRDHAARHHAGAPPPADMTQNVTNAQTKNARGAEASDATNTALEHHNSVKSSNAFVKKTHRKEDSSDVKNNGTERRTVLKSQHKFMVELWEGSATLEALVDKKISEPVTLSSTMEAEHILGVEEVMDEAGRGVVGEEFGDVEEVGGVGELGDAEEGHAARTHCTWPLPQKIEYKTSEDYVLEDDGQVEQMEGSEIFTVRSDLFLHDSVFHNEDSEQMCSAVRGCGSERALDADLTLDAPSVHIAQEELYSDAVDESSFRVLLLSGEELV